MDEGQALVAISNAHIADVFDLVADLLEFQDANPFRVRAYRNGARTIRDLPQDLATVAQQGAESLTGIPGIGKDLAAKCLELVQRGDLEMLEELRSQVPESVLQLMRIPGLGPKKAAALFRDLGITELSQLQAACEAGRIRQLKGFGAKTEQAILQGLSFATSASQRIRWADADLIVQELLHFLQQGPAVSQLEAAGSYRRGRDTVGDIDILAVTNESAGVMDRLAEFSGVETILARGTTKMSVRVRGGLQVDLRVVPAESFGAAMQYFTGSKDHNVQLRGRARQLGFKINEYGVFHVSGEEERRIAGATEAEVYGALGLPCFPPELREARREFEWADSGTLPQLIEASDLRGDLHMHTTASDGKATLREMASAAARQGLEYIAITDHSKRVSMARGLNGDRLRAQWQEIRQLQQEFKSDLTILTGVECDILEQGGMDLPDDVLAEADWVLASVHYGQNQSRAQITDRIVDAIKNPHVSAIAHPTGRLINRRAAYEVDMEAVFQAADEYGTLLELNANPYRLDLDDVHCAMAKLRGIPIVINSDAHGVDGLKVLRYGVLQARRGGLTRSDVANTWSWQEIKQRIGVAGR